MAGCTPARSRNHLQLCWLVRAAGLPDQLVDRRVDGLHLHFTDTTAAREPFPGGRGPHCGVSGSSWNGVPMPPFV